MSPRLEQRLLQQAQLHPQAIDLSLERSRCVLDRLGWRQPRVPVITVAGTNGKGSVAAYCTSMLSAAGYRVGTFTSPHLRDYRERIRIADRLVTEQELLWAFDRLDEARVTAPGGTPADEVSLTFFEFNALAAFLLFEAAGLDAWVLEVGMGGRLDAVNIVDATVAAVVSIGFDHQEFLGTTLDAIAREKAGILRRGCTAVLGSRTLPAALIDAAVQLGAVPKQLGAEFDCEHSAAGTAPAWRFRGARWDLPGLPPPALMGATQFDNAATAIAVLEELPPSLEVSPVAVAAGLTQVRLPGRFQVVAPGPGRASWILDVAHNPDAARVLAMNLRTLPACGRTLAVCGVLADKDAAAIAAALRGSFAAWWLFSTDGARGTPAAVLALRMADHIDVPMTLAEDVAAACAAAAAAADPIDRIVVFGSFHTVGPALDWLDAQGLLPQLRDPEYTVAPRSSVNPRLT